MPPPGISIPPPSNTPSTEAECSWRSFSAWSHFPLQIESNSGSLLWPMGGLTWPSPSQPQAWPYSPSAYQTPRPNFRTSNKPSSFSNSTHCICCPLCFENLSVHFPRLTIPARPSPMTQCEKVLCFSLCILSSFPTLSTTSDYWITSLLMSTFPAWASEGKRTKSGLLTKTLKTQKQFLAGRIVSKSICQINE